MRKMVIFLLLMVSLIISFPSKALAASCSGVQSGVSGNIPEGASSHTVVMNLEGYPQNQEYMLRIQRRDWLHNWNEATTPSFKPGENREFSDDSGTINVSGGSITWTITQKNLLARDGEELHVMMIRNDFSFSTVCDLGSYTTATNTTPSESTGITCELHISQKRGGKSCYLGDSGCLTSGGVVTYIEANIVADDGKPLSNDEPKPYNGWVRMDIATSTFSGKTDWQNASGGNVTFDFEATGVGNNTVTLRESETDGGFGLRVLCSEFTFKTEDDPSCASLCGDKTDVYKSTQSNVPFELCSQVSDPNLETECRRCFGESGVWTAIGCISTEPTSIIQTLITLGLGLGGGITLLLILAGAFRLSVSQGDPKQAEEAKEQITSAVIGLLFIIFSVVMLRFIGIQVLQIPGFGG